ncbi:MAG: cytochrome c oxidase assembly protein [Paracoccaceae bacterium]
MPWHTAMNPLWQTGLYCGPAPVPADILLRWNLDPILLLALAVMALTIGRRKSGAAAVAVLAIAFVSPLCALSAALFSARVVHHVLLIAVAAPLLAMALRPAMRPLALPAFLLSTVALWGWHLPVAYDAAMSNITLYWAMQVSLFVPAVMFWRAVLSPNQSGGSSIMLLWAGFMQMAFLGALLTLAPGALYAIHIFTPVDWGLSPLEDQQLGGLIMWIPAALPYLAFGGLVARRGWASRAERA